MAKEQKIYVAVAMRLDVSTALPHVDLNSTRINAKIELLNGTLRIERGLTLY